MTVVAIELDLLHTTCPQHRNATAAVTAPSNSVVLPAPASPRTASGHMESLVLDDYHVLIPRRNVGLIHSWDRGGLRSYI
jgi:hypothetical protein